MYTIIIIGIEIKYKQIDINSINKKVIAMEIKIDIVFDCYPYNFTEGKSTMFNFWPDGEWDEEKYVLEEALIAYPPEKYNWIRAEE